MRSSFVVTILIGLCAPALAGVPVPVVGGSPAPSGKWPDVAAVLFGDGTDIPNQADCTGTLIASNVVITAGHCDDPTVANVLLGTNSLTSGGEVVPVMKRIEYPNSQQSVDVTILVLSRNAAETPRNIATGWAKLDIKNSTAVQFVGYGATDVNGSVYGTDLMEVMSTITDFDCTVKSGCNALAMPDGELGAGGGGIDTCSGDSGGPMYLLTSYGTFLAGVTSRSYDSSSKPCGDGGIYERPDKIVDWAEQQTGIAMARGPEPSPSTLSGVPTGPIEVHVDANDPLSDDHTFAITTPPAHGTAAIRDDGELRICLDSSAAPDSIGVTITDKHDGSRALEWLMPITVTSGDAPAACNANAFSSAESGGCCDAGGSPAGSLPLALGVLIMLRRRRLG
ncbi:MAG TPA: trypsin-like serine protease [Kofleriaceae bacterium]